MNHLRKLKGFEGCFFDEHPWVGFRNANQLAHEFAPSPLQNPTPPASYLAMAQEHDHIRAFISIHLDPDLLGQLRQFQKTLDQTLPPKTVRWTSPDQLHLTLKFLGNIPTQELAEIQNALDQIGKAFAPMTLRAEGFGAFPNLRSPRVIWIGLQGDLAPLEQLNTRIEQAMQPWAEKQENRPFHPHLTLGRIREDASRHARAIAKALEQTVPPPFGQWRAQQFHLMRSQLSPHGAIHTVLAKFPFNSPVAASPKS
jgi:RNA 2',3'-cyclic 3'-phosphodiesterase